MPLYNIEYSYDEPQYSNFHIEAASLEEAAFKAEKQLEKELPDTASFVEEIKEIV